MVWKKRKFNLIAAELRFLIKYMERYYLLQNVHTGPEAQPANHSMGTVAFSKG